MKTGTLAAGATASAPAPTVAVIVPFVVSFAGTVETEPVAAVLQALQDVDDPVVAAVDVVIVVVVLLATWKMIVRIVKLDRAALGPN